MLDQFEMDLADIIIQHHHNGIATCDWDDLPKWNYVQDFFPKDWTEKQRLDTLYYIQGVLIDNGIIEVFERRKTYRKSVTRLTAAGYQFNSFKHWKRRRYKPFKNEARQMADGSFNRTFKDLTDSTGLFGR